MRGSVEHRLSKVQSSGHGAGHYMGFWGFGGGNRLPWDRSSSSFFPFFLSPSLPHPPSRPPTLSVSLASYPGLSNRRQNLYLAAATEMHPRLNGGRAFKRRAPRTVKRKIYGFQKNGRRSILQGRKSERQRETQGAERERERGTLDERKEKCYRGRKWESGCVQEGVRRENKRRERLAGEFVSVSWTRSTERENQIL